MDLEEIIRRAGGVSKLAKIAGVDHSTVAASWRRTGKVPWRRVKRIADALGVPPEEIRPWEDNNSGDDKGRAG